MSHRVPWEPKWSDFDRRARDRYEVEHKAIKEMREMAEIAEIKEFARRYPDGMRVFLGWTADDQILFDRYCLRQETDP